MSFYLPSPTPDEIYHHGILGQKWGVRRFQNPDGTLTSAGRQRYYNTDQNGLSRLNNKGRRYNKTHNDRVMSYRDATFYNLKKTDPRFSKEIENLKELNKKNMEYSIDYINKAGKYVPKEDIYNKWKKTDYGKQEEESLNRIENMIRDVAKEHPLFDKKYVELHDDPSFNEVVKFGDKVVKEAMRTISADIDNQNWQEIIRKG